MKEKIQKYLAGEREGFSLVELIIVIAIMAILIGVVTLAVLPNIAKSKESKDITALDSLLSALNNAVASEQVTGTGSFALTMDATNKKADFPTSGTSTVADATAKLFGKTSLPLSSAKALTGAKIVCSWDTGTGTGSSGSVEIKVAIVDGTGNTITTDYLGSQKFETKN